MAEAVLTTESRLFEVDFGFIDFMFSTMFIVALYARSRRRASRGTPRAWSVFKATQYFGAFAFFCDYGIYYHLQGTRTVEYPVQGTGALGPIEKFWFFFWFDWINAVPIVGFALLLCEDLLAPDPDGGNPVEEQRPWALMTSIPLWFWATPGLSRALSLDDRMLLVDRPSEKQKYWILMAMFISMMLFWFRMRVTQVARVFMGGVCCGLIHHAPLFAHSMRGYSSPTALVVTLCTEWPAIMCGLFVMTKLLCGGVRQTTENSKSVALKKDRNSRRGTRGWMASALFGLILAFAFAGGSTRVLSIKDVLYNVMPYIPGSTFQAIGTVYLRTFTCALPRLGTPLACSAGNTEEDMWVVAAAPKGGAVVSSLISTDIGWACGRCVGSGGRPHERWPGPEEPPPTYASTLLLAIANMRAWPSYVSSLGYPPRVEAKGGKATRCVVVIRDPAQRLRSLFLYAFAGRETWFREQRVDERLRALMEKGGGDWYGGVLGDPSEAVEYFLDSFGLAYLDQSHDYLVQNLDAGCTPIRFEDLVQDFNSTMDKWFDAWAVPSEGPLRDALRTAVASNDPAAQTADNHHVTSAVFARELKQGIARAILKKSEVAAIVKKQRLELGYV